MKAIEISSEKGTSVPYLSLAVMRQHLALLPRLRRFTCSCEELCGKYAVSVLALYSRFKGA